MEKQKVLSTRRKIENIEVQPDHGTLQASSLLEKGNLFQQTGRVEMALTCLREAFERFPETTEGKIARVKFAALRMRS